MLRTSLFALIFSAAIVPMAAGCAAQASGDNSGSSSSNLTQTDQTGTDVQVLQIWTAGRVFPTATPGPWFGPTKADISLDAVDPTVCPVTQTLGSGGSYSEYQIDCTGSFAKAAPFDVDGTVGPTLDPVLFTVTKDNQSGSTNTDPDYCNKVEVRVVVRDAAAAQPTFSGVGFSTNKGASFAQKSDLQAVGHVTLKNGDAATVYRFVGISTCISEEDSTSGNAFQTFTFKPYAAYDAAGSDGNVTRYRVWENVPNDFAIGRSWPGATPAVNSTGFDRQGQLLSQ